MSKRDDLELVARFLAGGDREALGELLERYRSASYGLALHVTRSSADAEDACQEAALRATRALESFDPSGSFRAWYLKTTCNVATDLVRRRGARKAREEKVIPTRASEPPSTRMEQAELHSAVAGALRAVEPRYRLPVVLRYEQGLTYRETAAVLSLSEHTARTYASRGIEKLRERLARAGFALVPAIIAGTLKSSAGVTVPASVGTALAKIAATATLAPQAALGGAGAAGAAGTGALKGGIVLKAVTSVIAAGAIAAAVAVSTGMGGGGGSATPASPGPGVVYDDRFETAALAPFWEGRKPADCAETGDRLALRIPRGVGTGAAEIRSRSVRLGAGPLEVLVEHSNYGGNSSWRRNSVELLDEDGRTLCSLERVIRGKGGYRFVVPGAEPVNIAQSSGVGRSFAIRFDRTGRASLLSKNRELARGRARSGVRAVKLRVFMEMGQGTYFSWTIDRIAVKRLEAWPEASRTPAP